MRAPALVAVSAAVIGLLFVASASVSGVGEVNIAGIIEGSRANLVERAAPTPEARRAPLQPQAGDPRPPGTGLIQPPMDLSHLTGERMPLGVSLQALPDELDWRDRGGQDYVTDVENQNPCGSCYAFGFLGGFESRLLIDGAGSFNFSQNHAKECNWRELNHFQYPGPGDYWGSCDGGNAFMLASLFSQKGTVLEACDPYVPADVACNSTCSYQKTLLDWRLINGGVVPDTQVLKQYIYDKGPIITSMDVSSARGFDSTYDGSYTFNYTTPGNDTNHCVLIVGWSDRLPSVPGGTGPAEGWIVRNSWGTSWGNQGYFYITYGAGNIGTSSSFVHAWQDYDSDGDIWYYDDDGWWSAWGLDSRTAWGLAKFISDRNTYVKRVEFWTTDATADVDVYVYDSFDGSTLSHKLAEVLNNSYDEAGYRSVELSPPLAVSTGDDVVAVVKFTNRSSSYPVVADPHGSVETERTYISASGSVWTDMGTTHSTDVAIRLRTSGIAPPGPTLREITPATGLNTGVVHVTNLAGSNFQAESTVKLVRTEQADIEAININVVDSSRITCDFDLTGAAAGLWDVVVTVPDARSDMLSEGFRVRDESGVPDGLAFLPLMVRGWPPIPERPVLKTIDNLDGDGYYTVRWTPAARATAYVLQEDDTTAFSTPTEYSPITSTWRFIVDKGIGDYHYRVKAFNDYGSSGWSGIESVTVVTSTPTSLVNGDFEDGPTGWTEFSTHGWDIVVQDFLGGVAPHSGSWAAWLGWDHDDLSYVQQQATVPPGSPYLSYWQWVMSQDVCGYDFAGVSVNGSTVVDQCDLCKLENTGGWVRHTIDLSGYAGQTVSLRIWVETDGTLSSNLFVDDVQFASSAQAESDSQNPRNRAESMLRIDGTMLNRHVDGVILGDE